MAMPRCMKCESTRFALTTVNNIRGSGFKLNLVHCDICGATVGVVDYYNTAILLEKIAKRLGFSLHG